MPASTSSPAPTATPVPAPTATPLSDAARIERMRLRLERLADAAPGRLGIAVIDLARDTHVSVRGDEAFPLAGVERLAIALTLYRRADQRRINLEDRVLLTAADLRRGVSPLADQHPRGNVSLPIWALARAMLVNGDNTASDVILRAVGGPAAVQALLSALGLRGFAIRKSAAQLAADARAQRTFALGGDNAGTPNGVAALLEGLAREHFLLLDGANELMNALDDTELGAARLRAGLPPAVRFAHTTGTSETFAGTTDATNDAGIFTLPGGRRIVLAAFLHASPAGPAERERTLASAARIVYEGFA